MMLSHIAAAKGLVFTLLNVVLLWSVSQVVPLFLPLGMSMLTLNHCILEVLEITLRFKTGSGLLNNVGTAKLCGLLKSS